MYDPELSRIIDRAISRLNDELSQYTPFMAGQASAWMSQLSGTAPTGDYFKHPLAFPALLLPWWAEKTIRSRPNPVFQAKLAYSTINGYFYIRLIDNLMDDQPGASTRLLPILNFFHSQFQLPYQDYFGASHAFWEYFGSVWFHSGNVTMQDAMLSSVNRLEFEQIASQKVCAAKIPLAAVYHRHQRPDSVPAWSAFVDVLGRWHQFLNDLFDWFQDDRRGAPTYFLSEARQRRNHNETVARWVAREGYDWALDTLESWMLTLKQQATDLGSDELGHYLDKRQAMVMSQKETIKSGLEAVARLSELAEKESD